MLTACVFPTNECTGTDCIASSICFIGWQVRETTTNGFLLPLHYIPRCHKNKKHINSKYDNTPFRAIPCFFSALRCAFFELVNANYSIQKTLHSAWQLRRSSICWYGQKSNNGYVAGEGNPGFHSPLSLRAARIHSIPLFVLRAKKIKNFVPFRFRDRFTALYGPIIKKIKTIKLRSALYYGLTHYARFTSPFLFASLAHITSWMYWRKRYAHGGQTLS